MFPRRWFAVRLLPGMPTHTGQRPGCLDLPKLGGGHFYNDRIAYGEQDGLIVQMEN